MKQATRLNLIFTLSILLLSPLGYAAESAEMINRMTCASGSDTRELEIVAKDAGHVVNYTKQGATKEVGTCSTNKSKCQEIFERIKANLEKSGFTCKV